jgi:hypothetical protein
MTTSTTTCPAWCTDTNAHTSDHWGPRRFTAATAGEPWVDEEGASYSCASVSAYKIDDDTPSRVSVHVVWVMPPYTSSDIQHPGVRRESRSP